MIVKLKNKTYRMIKIQILKLNKFKRKNIKLLLKLSQIFKKTF